MVNAQAGPLTLPADRVVKPTGQATVDENNRRDRRFHIEIPVFVSTVLDGRNAAIVDVSQQGLRLHGTEGLAARMRVIIEFEGDAVCGTVRWAKPDGSAGVRLDTPLRDGRLAAIWHRFQENVSAFGAQKRPVQTGFGTRTKS
jgi:hypothetical protein